MLGFLLSGLAVIAKLSAAHPLIAVIVWYVLFGGMDKSVKLSKKGLISVENNNRKHK